MAKQLFGRSYLYTSKTTYYIYIVMKYFDVCFRMKPSSQTIKDPLPKDTLFRLVISKGRQFGMNLRTVLNVF